MSSEKVKNIKKIFNINQKITRYPDFLDDGINVSGIVFIHGKSGSGKSVNTRKLADTYNYKTIDIDFCTDIPIVDVISYNLPKTLRLLNKVGLSEPYLYLSDYNSLSTGEKFRFILAYVVSKGYKKIYIDEFCSYLDRDTAKIVSHLFQSLLRENSISALLVSAHDDIVNFLKPDISINIDLYGEIIIENKGFKNESTFLDALKVTIGSFDDYERLSRYHYFPDAKKEICDIFRAKYINAYYKNDLAAILVIKNPYPKDVDNSSLCELNNNVKIIYRIIVHPTYRGIGIPKLLFTFLTHMFNDNQTFFLNSALAEFLPIFESIGMDSIPQLDYYKELNYINFFKSYSRDKFSDATYNLAINIFSHVLFNSYVKYCKYACLKRELNIDYFEYVVSSTFYKDDIDALADEIKFFKMKEYVYKPKGVEHENKK
ncbi:MAG: hypothetical protein LBI63_05490 [Candidatus Ancillula sp.]|jgi:ABC-type dipeptide/oligopeptide/nickel transport system ATPase subunit|nr:hypothetical protein [Candidatus Ancillula sp.]